MSPLPLLAVLFLSISGFEQKSHSAQRFDEFVAAFNSKDAGKIRAMAKKSFSPQMFATRKEDAWVQQTLAIGKDLAPLAVKKTLLDQEDRFVALCSTARERDMGVMVMVETTAPFAIVGIQISPEPDELLIPIKRAKLDGYSTLSDLANKVLTELKPPAIGVGEWRDGKVVTAVAGMRKFGGTEPVTAQDRWLIGSNTKSMTATLMATFIQEGKLNWDSKLGDMLAGIPMKAGYKSVTLEQLMQHMGGIPQDMNFTGAVVDRIVNKETDPQKIRLNYARDILNREPIAKPGERFAYSNAGYALLSVIAERIGGKPFADLMKERVFVPIGMKSAICGIPGEEGMPGGVGQPSGHFDLKGGPRAGKLSGPLNFMCVGAGAGVACSLDDLAKYVGWHMRGYLGESVPGLSSALIKRLHTPLPRKPGVEMYAAGWVIADGVTDSPMHEHAGSDGTFMAEMAFWPQRRFAAVAIVNMGGEQSPSPALQALLAMYRTDGKKLP